MEKVMSTDRYWGANLSDTSDPVAGQTWKYDANGNILTKTVNLILNSEISDPLIYKFVALEG